MGDQARFNVLRIKLDTASDRRQLANAGHTFQVVDASSSSAAASLTIGEADGKAVPIKNGFGWTHSPFTALYVTHDAQAGEWLDVVIGGEPGEARPEFFRVFGVSQASAVTIEGQSGNVDIDIVSQTLGGLNVNAAPVADVLDDRQMDNASESALETTSSVFQVAYTVPAGRKAVIRRAGAYGTGPGYLQIDDGANALVTAGMEGTFNPVQVFDNYQLAAGYRVKIRSSIVGQTAGISMWIEEKDA